MKQRGRYPLEDPSRQQLSSSPLLFFPSFLITVAFFSVFPHHCCLFLRLSCAIIDSLELDLWGQIDPQASTMRVASVKVNLKIMQLHIENFLVLQRS